MLPIASFYPPAPNQSLTGKQIIGGWAIHESGIQAVHIYLDRSYVMDASLGVDRPDVARVYPAFRKEMITGWNALFDAGSVPPGPHELIARVRAKDGAEHDVSVPVVIAK
jgi:N-acetylmuramoyl-L-alanine amidase